MCPARKQYPFYLEQSRALDSHGHQLSARFGPLLAEGIRSMPTSLGNEMAKNAADKAFLSDPGKENPDTVLYFRMSLMRECVLAAAVRDFRSFGREMGWSRDTIRAAIRLVMPIWDLSERLCVGYYGHQHRTMEYGRILLDKRGVHGIERAIHLMGILLHDIGKAAVPAENQRIRGRRRIPEEVKEMQQHPAFGKSIIFSASDSLAQAGFPLVHIADIAEVAYSHQMTYDGIEGYPRGPVGKDIPISGRICCFCDSFETMTSFRIYKPDPKNFTQAQEDAFARLDAQFNANIVRNFFSAAESPEVRQRIFRLMHSSGGTP